MPSEVTLNIYNPKPKRKLKVKPAAQPIAGASYVPAPPPPDRCKAARWMYLWLHDNLDYLANTSEGNDALTLLNSEILLASKSGLRRVIREAIIGIMIALAGSPGPTPDDPIIILAVIIIGEAIGWALEDAGILPQYEPAEVEDTRAKVSAISEALICDLASSKTQNAYDVFQASIDGLTLTTEQRLLCKAWVNPVIIGLMEAAAWWLPNFEGWYLSDISGDCC